MSVMRSPQEVISDTENTGKDRHHRERILAQCKKELPTKFAKDKKLIYSDIILEGFQWLIFRPHGQKNSKYWIKG